MRFVVNVNDGAGSPNPTLIGTGPEGQGYPVSDGAPDTS